MNLTNRGRWLLSWALYWLGDTVSRLDRWDVGWLIDLWMPVYQATMRWSSDIQGESEFGPWRTPPGRRVM